MKRPKASWDPKRRKWGAKGVSAEGKRRTFWANSQKEAADKAADSFGLEVDADTLYGYYATAYLPTIVRRSENWKAQVGWAMDGYVLPHFGDMRLPDITRAEAQKFFNRLKIGASSIQRIKIVFSGVMNLAEDDELIPKNPVRRVRLPSAPAPEKNILSFSELAALLDACHEQYVPPVLLMACSLNVGEACAVRRTHVTDCIKVRRQILQPKGGAVDSTTLKTPQRKRDIPIPAWVAEKILNANQKSSIWVSSSVDGGYILPKNVGRELDRITSAHGLKRVTPHELRHTIISLLENELGCPQAIVAAIAGKIGRGITAGYSHPSEAQKRKWLELFWQRVLEQTSTYVGDKQVSPDSSGKLVHLNLA